MLVECIEHGLELHLRHLGEHPDVFDVDTLGQGQPGFHNAGLDGGDQLTSSTCPRRICQRRRGGTGSGNTASDYDILQIAGGIPCSMYA